MNNIKDNKYLVMMYNDLLEFISLFPFDPQFAYV